MTKSDLHIRVSAFPKEPGVYLMKNAAGDILYVGKATNLRSRVGSYFSKESNSRYQISFLMSKVSDIETILTHNTKEALLLENTLIKKHRPRYNIELKDDKSYVSLKLSLSDTFPRLYVTRRLKKDGSKYYGPYARAGQIREIVDFIETHFRLRTCNDHDFRNRVRPCLQYQIKRCDAPCVSLIGEEDYRKIVEQVRCFLEGRSDELKESAQALMRRASEGEDYEAAARYRDLIYDMEKALERQKVVAQDPISRDVIGFFREGERVACLVMMVRDGSMQESRRYFLKSYEEDPDLLSSFLNQYYEEGKFIPAEILLPMEFPELETLQEILSDRAGRKVQIAMPKRGEKSALLRLANENAEQAFANRKQRELDEREVLTQLQEKLELKSLPRRIECYDISNFQGKESVGSMVCFVDGKPHKGAYRHFKIKTVDGSNDFASIYEVMMRRLKKGLEVAASGEESEWALPQLIVIDGGKGQLHAAAQAFKDMSIEQVDLISLAKSRLEGEESPFLKTPVDERKRSEERVFLKNRKDPIFFPNNSSVLFLLVQLRDEAHRFGIEFHRKLRKKRTLFSALDEITGVGKIRRQKLLRHFGSLKRVKEADAAQIAQAIGVSEDLGRRIRESL